MWDIPLSATVTLLGLLTVGLYIWSARAHFESEGMTGGSRLIAVLVIGNSLLLLYLTWTVPAPVWARLAGIAVIVASLVLFGWAIRTSRAARLRIAFDPARPRGVLDTGPYGIVRHPFYVSYIMFWTGWTLAAWSVWGVLTLVFAVIVYARAARMEEANFAGSPHAEAYRAYKQRTGFFWPKLL